MGDVRDPETDQQLPVSNDLPTIHEQVTEDLMGRQRFGVQKYGHPLQPFNGRDPLRDAYEEVLDASAYMKQAIVEAEMRVRTVYAVRYGNYEPSEVLALYDNEAAAIEHAAHDQMSEVVPMRVKSEFKREEWES